MTLKLTIWAYPGAPGLRQQLWAKGRVPAESAHNTAAVAGGGRVDYLPVNTSTMRIAAAGYFQYNSDRPTDAYGAEKPRGTRGGS